LTNDLEGQMGDGRRTEGKMRLRKVEGSLFLEDSLKLTLPTKEALEDPGAQKIRVP